MSIYSRPEGDRFYGVTFYRLGEVIAVSEPEPKKDPYRELNELRDELGIRLLVGAGNEEEPLDTDKGTLRFYGGHLLVESLYYHPFGLRSPERVGTLRLVEEASTGWKVFGNRHAFYESFRGRTISESCGESNFLDLLAKRRQQVAVHMLGRQFTGGELTTLDQLDPESNESSRASIANIPVEVILNQRGLFEHYGAIGQANATIRRFAQDPKMQINTFLMTPKAPRV